MYTELCLEWPNKKTDKLTRESHVKQLSVDSTIYALLFIWQTSDWQLPYFSFEKKMYKIEKILPAASSCTHLISTEMKLI